MYIVCHAPIPMTSYICHRSNHNVIHSDFKVTLSGCHSVIVLSTPICNSIVATVTDLYCHLIII